jgi:nitrogen fixation protein NifB
MEKVLEKEPRISVAGIAGPGDPFANPTETIGTMRLIRKKFPKTILCLASNGLNIAPYIKELAEINVSHVTITVNAVDPTIGARIYSWVRDGKVVYQGVQAAELLLERQLEAVAQLKKHDITVKINTILIPDINDAHIMAVASKMKELGADLFNCMAMFPNVGTPFGNIRQPDKKQMADFRNQAEAFLPQMRHCTRCRADAVGLLDNDKTEEFRGCLSSCASLPATPGEERLYVAVSTHEGVLVNQHLGEAYKFQIWGKTQNGFQIVTEREAPDPGNGVRRWTALTAILNDCRAVLTSALGKTPDEILTKSGIQTVTMSGFIEDGLAAIYEGRETKALKGRRRPCAVGACGGSGGGCG